MPNGNRFSRGVRIQRILRIALLLLAIYGQYSRLPESGDDPIVGIQTNQNRGLHGARALAGNIVISKNHESISPDPSAGQWSIQHNPSVSSRPTPYGSEKKLITPC